MNFFVAVERIENWKVDKENDYSFYGLPERHVKKASAVAKGDILLAYVSSGLSAFTGARRVVSDDLVKLAFGGDYDVACPYALSTEPIVSLEPSQWVPVRSLVDKLDLTRSRDWRQQFRTSIKPISEPDGQLILHCLKVASASQEEG